MTTETLTKHVQPGLLAQEVLGTLFDLAWITQIEFEPHYLSIPRSESLRVQSRHRDLRALLTACGQVDLRAPSREVLYSRVTYPAATRVRTRSASGFSGAMMHVLSTGHNRDLSRKVGQVPSRIEAARLAELEPQRHPTNLLIAPSGDYVEVQAQSRALAKCHSGCVLLRSSHPEARWPGDEICKRKRHGLTWIGRSAFLGNPNSNYDFIATRRDESIQELYEETHFLIPRH